jgi:phage tail sheath protein FI
MADYRRPDVYIEEKPSFPGSVLEIESAIPVFIGYTENDPTPGEPVQVSSMQEFEASFGGAFPEDGISSFIFNSNTRQVTIMPEKKEPEFMLHYAMRHYFLNGGAKCFVLSSGTYAPVGAPVAQAIVFNTADFATKVQTLLTRALEIEEATLFVIPELVKLAVVTLPVPAAGGAAAIPANINYANITGALSQTLQSLLDKQKLEKFFILDVVAPDGINKLDDIKEFDESGFAGWTIERKGEFMALYYPYLVTTFRLELDDTAIDNLPDQINMQGGANSTMAKLKVGSVPEKGMYEYLKQQLKANAPAVILPPSAAMAGIYVSVDDARGVWKAPANVSVANINGLTRFVDDSFHEDLNINPLNGRSICAIRTLPGYGTRVMGGRTLRGGSNDFCYSNVRRFVSVAEKSIKNALKQYLFEPNNPATWGLVKGAISNYLSRKWLQGALLGAKAEDSFFVRIGLGITMSKDDVLNGRMIVDVGMAVVRPAEFIILRFEQFLPAKL